MLLAQIEGGLRQFGFLLHPLHPQSGDIGDFLFEQARMVVNGGKSRLQDRGGPQLILRTARQRHQDFRRRVGETLQRH